MPAGLAGPACPRADAEGDSAEPLSGRKQRPARPDASGSSDPARDLALAWPEVVGREAAANSQPVRLRQGKLVVAASSTAWAQTLQFMEETIKARLRTIPGMPQVERVQFRHAGWEEWGREKRAAAQTMPAGASEGNPCLKAAAGRQARSQAGPEDVPGRKKQKQTGEDQGLSDEGLSAEQKQALAEVRGLGLNPVLEEKITRAMRAAFVRGERDSAR